MSLSQNYPTTRPTLTLDFAKAKRVDPRVTFTRVTAATYFDASGTLRSAAANAPRIDFDPATLACRGLLVEEQRANLLTYSADFGNIAWQKQSTVSVSDNTTVAPDGTTSGDTVTAGSGLAIYQTVTATIGITYCQSVFIKAGTAARILFRDDTGAGRDITINPSTGAITATSGTLVGSDSYYVGNGWYRYWFSYIADSSTIRGLLRPDSAGSAQTFIVWGAQSEAGAFPTSYIPTTTTSLTRSADVASVTTLSPWFNSAEGTIYVESSRYALGGSGQFIVAEFGSTASNNDNLIQLGTQFATTNFQFLVNAGGSLQAALLEPGTVSLARYAATYKANDFAYTKNGSVPIVDPTGSIPTVLQLNIGSRPAFGNTGFLNGHIQRITYYNTRLPNAQLQALTAP